MYYMREDDKSKPRGVIDLDNAELFVARHETYGNKYLEVRTTQGDRYGYGSSTDVVPALFRCTQEL
jgi:hypothetical protein